MSTPCVLIENGRCYYASMEEASRADARRNPGTAQEYVASWSGMARDRLDAFIQEKDRNFFLKIGTRGAAVPLAFYSAVADTALSVVGGLAPSLHAMATGGVSAKQVIVGMGDKLLETAVGIPIAYKEIAMGDHPANAAHKAYCGILDSYMIVSGGAGVIRGGMTLAGKTLAPIRRVAEGAADAVANTTMGGGMGMVLAEGAVLADGGVATATVAAAGGWPSGLWSLAAMSEAAGTGGGRGESAEVVLVINSWADLEKALVARGIPYNRLADELGVRPSTISNWKIRGNIPNGQLPRVFAVLKGYSQLPPGAAIGLYKSGSILPSLIEGLLPENIRGLVVNIVRREDSNKFTLVTTDGKAYEFVVTGTIRELQ